MARPALALRALLEELTEALATAERDDAVLIDASGHVAWVDSTLDDVDHRFDARSRARARGGFGVLRPDGLWEWAVRRDFVRGLARGTTAKRRLAATLAGPKTRRRFQVALSIEPALVRAFELHRRRRLRGWAGRVLRAHAAAAAAIVGREVIALVDAARAAAAAAALSIPVLTPRQQTQKRKRRARQMRRSRPR